MCGKKEENRGRAGLSFGIVIGKKKMCREMARKDETEQCVCVCVSVNVPTGISGKIIRTAECDSPLGVIGQAIIRTNILISML